jgi:predicted phage terminase large subunit-like protein
VSEPEVQRILLHSDGPALWPERYDAASLAAIQNTVGGYFFESLYQGNPRPKGGLMFRREWFASRVSGVPRGSTFCRFWDKAASQGKGDWTVGTLMARDPEGRFTVVNVVRARLSPNLRDRKILDTAHADRLIHGNVAIRGDQDPAAAGKADAEAFVRLLAGFDVKTKPVSGDKETNARPFASQCEAGNVSLVDGPWVKDWLDELEAFPNGKFDDQVDASSGAFNYLAGTFEARWGRSPLARLDALRTR